MAHPVSPDVSECEREPVHIPGAIQPFGALVAFELPTWAIAHVSANAPALFGRAAVEAMIGQCADKILLPKLVHDLRNTFQAAMISGFAERLPGVAVGPAEAPCDILVYASGALAVAEFIPQAGADAITTNPIALVKTIIDRLRRTATFQSFLASAARQIRAVTGFDRVMIYRFLDDDSGQVVAEASRAGLPPFLDLRYPASDIPAQVRALFKRQWLRAIPCVDYEPVPIVPATTSRGLPVDLTLSTLRSVSPIHLQYLRNMGVTASMTVSIVSGDRLWGLIACHHETARRITSQTAAAVELFAQVFSTQIEAKERQDELAYIAKARELLERLMAAMQPEETIFENLKRFSASLQEMIPCDGIGVWTDGRFEGVGVTPPADGIEDLVRFLNQKRVDRVFQTAALSLEVHDATRYADRVAGLIAIPFSRAPRDFVLLFRREVVQTVTWGGNPNKPVQSEAGRHVLGPRASFEAWKEIVRGTAKAWRPTEIEAAESLRISLLDVILRRANLVDRERKIAHESQVLIVAELNHRIKNVLAVISSLVRQSQQGHVSLDSFSRHLQARIHALAVAHDQLTQSHWKAAPLLGLIEAEAQAWVTAGDARMQVTGLPVMVEARAYQTLALVFHELMTNAAKYGALSVPNGRLTVTWSLGPSGELHLAWQEENGPSVRPPSRRGFGSLVLEQSIPFELRGDAAIDYRPEGVGAKFVIPAEFVQRGGAGPVRRELAPGQRADLNGKTLLLVEDSMMIALDAQAMLQSCGAEVELAATTNDARRALTLTTFDAAILDVNLYTETSYPIAEDLQARAIPFVFATGYGETITVPERFKNIHVIAKPYAEDALRAALAA